MKTLLLMLLLMSPIAISCPKHPDAVCSPSQTVPDKYFPNNHLYELWECSCGDNYWVRKD